MPDNYFGTPIAPYVPIYGESKGAEIAKLQRERYERNMNEYDTLKRAMGSIRTAPGDQPLVNDLENRVTGIMEDVVGSGAYHLGNRAVQNAVTEFATDKKVLDAMDTYAA